MAIFLTFLANLPPDLLQGLFCRTPGPILPILQHKPDPAGEGIHSQIIIIYPWAKQTSYLVKGISSLVRGIFICHYDQTRIQPLKFDSTQKVLQNKKSELQLNGDCTDIFK